MKVIRHITVLLALAASAFRLDGQNTEVINPIRLDAAVHVEKMTRSSQKGDTLVYNAAAFQTMQGADSETLLAKMPGVSVSESGVEAGGKEVRRILLDGQEFFGNDVLTALRTIPADMVKQIEVINRLSDNARLTGVDDGEGYMAINIVTRRKKGESNVSGRVYGSYGLPPVPDEGGKLRSNYIAGGNVSRFSDKNTINVIGMTDNISKFNFTTADILSGASGLNEGASKEFKVKSLPGISTVHSLGANYSDKKMNFSYFFNIIDNGNSQQTQKNTMTSVQDRLQSVTGNALSEAYHMSHRLSGQITLKPSKKHMLILRPELVFEDMANDRDAYSCYRYVYADADPAFIRNQFNRSSQDRWTFRGSASLSYRYSFDKRRRYLNIYARYSYYGNNNHTDTWQYYFRNEGTSFDVEGEDMYSPYIQDRLQTTFQHSATGKVSYTEPVGKRSVMVAEYTTILQSADGGNLVDVMDNATGNYEQSDRLSTLNRSTFLHNRLGGRYSYTKKKMNVVVNATYQLTGYTGRVTLPSEAHTERSYHHFLYQLTANLPFNKSNTLRLEVKSKTTNPSNALLQDVVNMSSRSHVRAGNPNLEPAYMHEAELRYVHTNKKMGSTFSLTATYTGSGNYFCDSLVINNPDFEVMPGVKLGANNQFVKPVNLKGYNNFHMRVAYGMPVDFLRCNLNINGTMQLKQLPSLVNGEYVPVRNNWYQLEGRLDSNISKNLDFMVGYNARYSQNQYSGKFGLISNDYLLHRVSAKIKWIFAGGFTLTGAAQYRQCVNTEGLYNDKMMLCDLFVGRKFLKDQNLEVSVGVNDLFDDNTRHYWHSVNASGTNDGYSIGLGRYLSVQCIWHIRKG